jgi:hypothetical protein
MSKACAEAFAEYDKLRQAVCLAKRMCDDARRIRNNLAAALGLSISTVLGVALALAAVATSGVGLPVAIALAIPIIGYLALGMSALSLGGLVVAIIETLKCENEVAELERKASSARAKLIEVNASDQEELSNYLKIPSGC